MGTNNIRSEKASLDSLNQTLAAIRKVSDPEEKAHLLLLAAELYADGGCRCEEKEVSYGERSDEAMACVMGLRKGRDELLATFKELVS